MHQAKPPDRDRQIDIFANQVPSEPSPSHPITQTNRWENINGANEYAEASQAREPGAKRHSLDSRSSVRHGAGVSSTDIGLPPQKEVPCADLGTRRPASVTIAKISKQQSATADIPCTQPRLMNATDVAAYLRMSESTVWRRVRKMPGFPQPFREDGLTRWDRHVVDAYLDRRSDKSSAGR